MSIYTGALIILKEWDTHTWFDSLHVSTHGTCTPHPHRVIATIKIAWSPPTPDSVINIFDKYVCNNIGLADVVMRDGMGNNIVSHTYNLDKLSMILVEAIVLCNNFC